MAPGSKRSNTCQFEMVPGVIDIIDLFVKEALIPVYDVTVAVFGDPDKSATILHKLNHAMSWCSDGKQ